MVEALPNGCPEGAMSIVNECRNGAIPSLTGVRQGASSSLTGVNFALSVVAAPAARTTQRIAAAWG